jgi:hypothetical protein
MSDDTSGTISKTKPKTDWRRLRSMTDDEIRARSSTTRMRGRPMRPSGGRRVSSCRAGRKL